MSIVAVHGPQTFGSKAVQGAGPALARVDPTNGMIWTFTLTDRGTGHVEANFVWTYAPAGGAPASGITDWDPFNITFTGSGVEKTITLTVGGSGSMAGKVYTFKITPRTGAAPQAGVMSLPPTGDDEEMVTQEEVTQETPVTPPAEEYDPGDHTVAEVQQYVEANPDSLEAVYEAEYQGKARSSLVAWLENRFPFDPGAWTVTEVLDYAAENPSELEDIIAAEQAGKNRTTLVSQLEAQR